MLTETVVPADTEGGGVNAAMATDELENIEHVETSVRAALLGKRTWENRARGGQIRGEQSS